MKNILNFIINIVIALTMLIIGGYMFGHGFESTTKFPISIFGIILMIGGMGYAYKIDIKNDKRNSIITNPPISNYSLNELEKKRLLENNSNIVKFSNNNGIGVGIECLKDDGDMWVDISDYDSW